MYRYSSMLCCAVLCCAVLCCAVLCCAVLCYAVLCCAVLCCAVLCCAVLCCAVLCCAVLCCAVLCCAVPPVAGISWQPHLCCSPSASNCGKVWVLSMCAPILTITNLLFALDSSFGIFWRLDCPISGPLYRSELSWCLMWDAGICHCSPCMSCPLRHSARASRGATSSGPALLSLSAASYTPLE